MIANKRSLVYAAVIFGSVWFLFFKSPQVVSIAVPCPKVSVETSKVPFMAPSGVKRFPLPLDHVDRASCKSSRDAIVSNVDRPFRFFLHPAGQDNIISESIIKEAATGKYYEEWVRNDIYDAVKNKPDAVILDIGANIGIHTLFLASQGYEVHAFEPHPANNRLLACSIIYNNFYTVKFNPFGLSLEEAEACIETDDGHNQGHAVVNELKKEACKTSIKVKRLDTYLETNKVKPYLVKIDVEGYELRALSPVKEYFRANPPAVFLTEYSPSFMKTAGSDPKAFFDYFWDLGYEIKKGTDIILKNSDISNIPMFDLYIYRSDLL